jgi:predicted extracellular nuclease
MFLSEQKHRGAAALALALSTGMIGSAAAGTVINEVLGSTVGIDVEFIELYGDARASLAGLSLIVVESDEISANGTIDFRYDFEAGDALGDNGFFLIGTNSVFTEYGVAPNRTIATNSIENSSYTIALVEAASVTGSRVTGGESALDALGVTDGEPVTSFAFDAPVIGPDGSFLPAGGRRTVDGIDTDTAADWVLADFFLTDNFPMAGTGDTGGEIASASIMAIQGAGHTSPYLGQEVATGGVVTAVSSNGLMGWSAPPSLPCAPASEATETEDRFHG